MMRDKRLIKYLPFIISLLLISVATGFYSYRGYSTAVFYFWLSGISSMALHFFNFRSEPNLKTKFKENDLYAIGTLLIIFIPLYLALIYYIPYQINTDEQAIMFFSKELTNRPAPDIFGISNYFNYPSLIFIAFGSLANAFGGIDLLNYRIVHALSALLIIIFSYVFFRLASKEIFGNDSLMAYLYALGGAVVLGSSHALIAISRMAMRDNSALLIEIIALTFLFLGLKRKCLFYIFLGSIAVGLSFYVYLPARITIFLWFFLLVSLLIFFRNKYKPLEILKYASLTLLGTALVISPLIVSTIRANETEFLDIRHKLLIFPEAQQEQKEWVNASTIYEGLKINTIKGLTAFNKKTHDNNFIYLNRNHGFVDPLTGILIWVGLLSVLLNLIVKKEKNEIYFLSAGSFLVIWLFLSFLLNKNPHYNRLLLILPFIAFLVIESLRNTGNIIDRAIYHYFKKVTHCRKIIFTGTIILIVILNLSILGDFVKKGFREGDALGGTARYQEARSDIPEYKFYLTASQSYPYYSYGEENQWRGWLKFFINQDVNQESEVLSPEILTQISLEPPFTIFMNDNLWRQTAKTLRTKYPNLKLHTTKFDGSRLAIEVQ